GQGPSGGAGLRTRPPCRAVALCRFSDVAGIEELGLRNGLSSLLRTCRKPLSIQSSGEHNRCIRADHGGGAGGLHPDHAFWSGMGRLDAKAPQMKNALKILFLLAALLFPSALVYAHVGSADVYYEGNAGPYPLFVTVRMPQVIPGVATI